MKFEEKNFRKLEKVSDIFVYLLIKNGEVIYVGQTQNGIISPYKHKYNKDFDDIYLIECKENELDYLQDKYIKKYCPIYNRDLNKKVNYSLTRIRTKIKEIYPEFDLRKVKKIVSILEIPTFKVKNVIYVDKKYYVDILKYYEEKML